MADYRTIAEIEADLARERAALNDNLSALQEKLSVKGVAKEALSFLNLSTSQPVRNALESLDGSVRSNPLAALLAGGALVWLASAPANRRGRATGEALRPVVAPISAATAAAAAVASVVAAMEPQEIRAVADEMDKIYRAGAARLKALDADIRRKAQDVKDSVKSTSRQTRDYAAEKAQVVADVAAEVKARLEGGLEGLSEEAAKAVIVAREKAYLAKRKASKTAGDAYGEVAAMVDRSPMTVGAAALAAGALAAVALRAFGGRR